MFADTFTNFYEPRHAMAAVTLAERLGYEVIVPRRVCCGRPLISKGFLDDAAKQAARVTETLWPLVEQGLPIVFCEPGCYSAVRDDHPHLLRGKQQEQARQVAAACLTFEQWAVEVASGEWRVASGEMEQPSSLKPQASPAAVSGTQLSTLNSRLFPIRNPQSAIRNPTRILLHSHCHQKALVGSGPAVRLLSMIPGCEVVDLDSGCCGMAGSFGYEREHYDISRAIGEDRLFPAIRDIAPETLVVAPGFSCRHQIRHFTGVQPLSTAELLLSW